MTSAPPPAIEDSISLSVATIGNVVKLERVPLTTTVADLVNSVRPMPVSDWSQVTVILRHPGSPAPKTLKPDQTLREAGARSGDTLIHAYPVRAASGWQEVAFFLATSSGAGVVGGAAYDLLKSTVRSAARRWRKGRGSATAPSLSRDEAVRIARACLSLDAGIDLRDLRSVEIAQNPASSSGAETWIVSFALAHSDIEVKVSVPDGEPEHTMVYIDHHSAGRLPQSPPTGATGTDIESRDRS